MWNLRIVEEWAENESDYGDHTFCEPTSSTEPVDEQLDGFENDQRQDAQHL